MVALGNWVTTSRRLCWLGWQSFSNRTRRHRRNGCDLEERVTSEKLLLEPFCEGGGSSSDSTVNTEAQAAPGGAPGWQVALRTVPLKRITGLCISPDISEAALSFFTTWAKTSTTAGGAWFSQGIPTTVSHPPPKGLGADCMARTQGWAGWLATQFFKMGASTAVSHGFTPDLGRLSSTDLGNLQRWDPLFWQGSVGFTLFDMARLDWFHRLRESPEMGPPFLARLGWFHPF